MRYDFCIGVLGFKRPFEEVSLSWPQQMTVQECGQQTVEKVLWRARHCRSLISHKVSRAFIRGGGGPRLQDHRRTSALPTG